VAEVTVTVAFLGFVFWAVARRWSEVRDVIGELSVPALGLSALAAVGAVWCSFLSWRALLADFGSEVPVPGAMRIFFVGQLSKYLPGKVWPILTQARLGRAYGVQGRTSAAAVLVTMLIALGTGLLVTVCALPVLGDRTFATYWWILLVLPVAAVALWPPVLNAILARLMRVARRAPLPCPLSLRGIARAVLWSVVSWLLFGVHLWALLADLGGTGADLLPRATGAFAGAWVIGFVLAVAPAGVGPREVALLVLLGSTVTPPAALVAALVSRLLMTVADLFWPAVALVGDRRRAAVPPVADTAVR
jgi:uncharacterized membrane protein YbhN (UPF0104 family)